MPWSEGAAGPWATAGSGIGQATMPWTEGTVGPWATAGSGTLTLGVGQAWAWCGLGASTFCVGQGWTGRCGLGVWSTAGDNGLMPDLYLWIAPKSGELTELNDWSSCCWKETAPPAKGS